jgi:AcrR family transcriptional regulator
MDYSAVKNPSKKEETRRIIVDAAERLFSQVGFQKTTLADIAHELNMSLADVFRFFPTRVKINEAVGRRLLSEVEVAVDNIVKNSGQASEKLRASVEALEKANVQRVRTNRKLHELIETAFRENWTIVYQHQQEIEKSLTKIISQGNRRREFYVEDCEREAVLVRTACIQFYDPRLVVNPNDEQELTLDQLVDFCLSSLRRGALGDHTLAGRDNSPRLNGQSSLKRHGFLD